MKKLWSDQVYYQPLPPSPNSNRPEPREGGPRAAKRFPLDVFGSTSMVLSSRLLLLLRAFPFQISHLQLRAIQGCALFRFDALMMEIDY